MSNVAFPSPDEIRECVDLDFLRSCEEIAYNACVYFNDCSVCDCANYDDKCDFELVMCRISELEKIGGV